MSEKIASGISYLFHPLLMPLYILLLLFGLDSFFALLVPFKFKLVILGIVFLTTIFFPLIIIFLLNRLKIIHSFFLEQKEERIYPLVSVALFYYLTYYMLKGVQFASFFSYYMLGATLLAILSLIITIYKKISLHMLGMGSFTGLFLGLSLNFGIQFIHLFLIGIFLSGLVGFARLKSNAHKPAEVYYGFLTGVLILTTLMLLL